MSTTNIKKCNKCSATDIEKDPFCGKCGNRLRYKSKEEEREEQKQNIINAINKTHSGFLETGHASTTIDLRIQTASCTAGQRDSLRVPCNIRSMELFNTIKQITYGELVFLRIPLLSQTQLSRTYFVEYPIKILHDIQTTLCLSDSNASKQMDYSHPGYKVANPNISGDMSVFKIYFKEDMEKEFPFLTNFSNWTERLDKSNFYHDNIYKLFLDYPVEFTPWVNEQYKYEGLKMKTGADEYSLQLAFMHKQPFIQ